MKNRISILLTSLFILSVLISSCSNDDDGAPTTGQLTGTVTDASTQEALVDVKILIFDASTNSPSTTSATSDAQGAFTVDLLPGDYYLKFFKQGYNSVPAPGIAPVSFTITAGQTTTQTAEMSASEIANGGYISGKVSEGSAGVSGALVIAENSSADQAYSTISDNEGNYSIYNVPAGNYQVKAFLSNYNSSPAAATVVSNTETLDINVAVTAGASGVLEGTIRNLATDNKDVDVTLVHPITKETIPGLSTVSVNQSYTMSNIPNGTYIARATYQNDERVMDPDRIAKFGEPEVTFAGNTIELTFDITNAVTLNSPSNAATSTQPVEINSTNPTFEWTAYSSTSDYVIEVVDLISGNVVWGGFDYSGTAPVKNIVIPSSQKSVVFNYDGSASINALVAGRTYRWKIYASKNDQNSVTGWSLISSSEDQLGLFKVVN